MADQQAPPAGPDLSKGVALGDFSGATLLGHVGDQEVLLVRRVRHLRHRRPLHPLSRTARGGVGSSARRSAALASRLLRPAHRRGDCVRRPSIRFVWSVESATAKIFVREKNASGAKAARQGSRRCARSDRHRRRRRGGICRCRDAAAAEVSRRHRHAEQRRRRRQSTGRICPRTILPAARRKTGCRCGSQDFYSDRALTSLKRPWRADRPPRAQMSCSPDDATCPTIGCCWRPAPSPCGCRSRAPISRMSICLRSLKIAGRSSPAPGRAARAW